MFAVLVTQRFGLRRYCKQMHEEKENLILGMSLVMSVKKFM